MAWLLWATLRGRRMTLLLMAAGLVALTLIFPHTYQAVGGPALAQVLEQMPPAFRAFLKAQDSVAIAATPAGYMGVGLRHVFILIIGAGFALATASGAVAGQVGRRTILLLLARPVARWRLLLTRIADTLVGLVLLMGALLGGVLLGLATAGLTGVPLDRLVLAVGNALLLFAAMSGYGYLISACSSDGGRALGIAGGVTAVAFVVDFLAGLWEPLELLGYASVFAYYDPGAVLTEGGVPWRDYLVLGATAVAGWAAALWVFQRRDIA